ncbi:MAG: phosphatidylserine decarboxylase [Ruminococcaceae bacterium]|nr:phosphatidylserine decarboxylase [Oscillospiraceae bacterium]
MVEYRDDSKLLTFLYRTPLGRLILRPLCAPVVSRVVGRYMDSRASRRLIAPFVRKHGIDLSACRKQSFDSFNDFFTRRLKPELRPMDTDPHGLISPCDGRLSVHPITPEATFTIKGSPYTLRDLLGGNEVWRDYVGGTCLAFRLCVNDYHRYHYPDSGHEGASGFIPGKLHTVRPIALESLPVYVRNSREYTLLHTDHFGTLVQIEIGALLVGKIRNHHPAAPFDRGAEKGMFLYGGSSIVLLLPPGRVRLCDAFPPDGVERQVLCGGRIGVAAE